MKDSFNNEIRENMIVEIKNENRTNGYSLFSESSRIQAANSNAHKAVAMSQLQVTGD